MGDLLEINNISYKYENRFIFRNISFSIEPGDLLMVKGPSGSGKSTLLRLLNRLADPTEGIITYDGKPLNRYAPTELRRNICYLQQTPLMAEGTVKQNLLLSFRFNSARNVPAPDDQRLLGLLRQFKLSDVSLEDNASKLSVGQKQRVAFIRALLVEPKVLLLDEPTSALDSESRIIIEEHIERLAADKTQAIVIVTHIGFDSKYQDLRTYELSQGTLVEVVN